MKIRLFRYGNFLNPDFWKMSWIVILFVVMFFIIGKSYESIAILIIALICFLVSPLRSYPKEFTADYEKITYVCPYYLKNRYGRGGRTINVRYEVTHITEIELKSNSFEKLFGLAHLSFTGYTTFDAGQYADRIKPKYRHFIYGIVLKKHRRTIDDFIKSVKNSASNDF